MTTHETRRIDLEDVTVVELACKGCRTAITIHLSTWSSGFPARCGVRTATSTGICRPGASPPSGACATS